MILKSIDIRNYRSLESVKLDNLQQFNVLIGRNNAGKSSVFQALYDLIRTFQSRNISPDDLTDRDNRRALEINLTFTPRLKERKEFINELIALGFDQERKDEVLESHFLRHLWVIPQSYIYGRQK
jgi:putative ATP-dependent endonuclease of the OLD family